MLNFRGKNNMKIYTIKFIKNGKKYGFRSSNLKLIKKIKRKVNYYLFAWYDPANL